MKIEIRTVGGYSEVGKNMTAIRVGNEVIICDMGFHLPSLISYEEDLEGDVREKLNAQELIHIEAIPDDSLIEDWKPLVKAIIPSHCHLDHIGAIPYLAPDYNCPVYGTPYTLKILKKILSDEKIKVPNKFISVQLGKKIQISKNIYVEFVSMTHSTLQVATLAIHTPAGIIVYANDFKLDNHPVLGKKLDYNKLKMLGKKGVKLLIMDSLYSNYKMKTPSERVAKELLRDIMLNINSEKKAVVVTTFASHISRLSSILKYGKKMKRKVVFLGRSLHKYIKVAESLDLIKFGEQAKIIGYSRQIMNELGKIMKNKEKYLIVCTGNQGEPGSILQRMVMGETPFKFEKEDIVIFSCTTIPSSMNKANREVMENKLKKKGVRLFLDIHVSGHGAREDHREMINMLKPEHIIPSHGDFKKVAPLVDLATEMGYGSKNVHLLKDGQSLDID